MKIIVAACAALCLLASACNHEDTGGGGKWARTVEPRLTTTGSWHSCTRPKLSPGRVVIDAQCAAPALSNAACEPIGSHEQANRMLVSQPQCTDAAVAALRGMSRTDAAAMSDLAGAYYVRAQRNDNPADLLNAFDAAQKAVDVKPQPRGAQFNYALILEALSLNADAIDAWQRAAATEEGRWAAEARAHRTALMAKKRDWPEVRAQIDAALNAHDVPRTRALIAEFPASAQKHFEQEVLPHSENSQIATFAEALSQFFKDRYFIDVAAASSKAREGHVRFAEARAAEANLEPETAAPRYREAAELLRKAGSPQYLLARIALAGQNPIVRNDYEASRKELNAIAAEGRSYPTVVARVELGRIYAYQFLDRYNDLFAAHEAAVKAYSGLADRDDLWNAYFSRFQETYDLRIRQLIGEKQIEKAFLYAERARAYEPLDLVRKLPTAPPEFLALAAQPDVAKLRSYLPPDTFLVEYRVFDDRTYAWILGRDVFAGQWLKATRDDVKRWADSLQNAPNNVEFDNRLFAPYDALLKGPLDVVRRAPANIVIVPDRELRGLPFSALRNPDTKHYLIEDHVPSISGSALLYVFALLRDREMATRDTSALLVGDPSFDPNWPLARGLKPLHFARREVEEIRTLYRSDVLIGNDATPQQFLRLAKDHAIVHIAAHGVVNADAPSQSFLLFDGLLNAEMLMNHLHTDKTRLVVLGACSSAGGLPVGAEGIAPLVRPIVGAGVPGVIGALWDIDDATASHLLVSFHDDYRRGSDAATALRDAQLKLLRSGKPANFWAPFQAIGYASSPFAPIENTTKEKPP